MEGGGSVNKDAPQNQELRTNSGMRTPPSLQEFEADQNEEIIKDKNVPSPLIPNPVTTQLSVIHEQNKDLQDLDDDYPKIVRVPDISPVTDQ